MTSAHRELTRRARRKWAAPIALASLCALLSACGNGFAGETAETLNPSGCASGRLGCATDQNIAALAARPSDLVRPRREQPRDAVRRDAVIAAYRQGTARAQPASAAGTTHQENTR